MTWASPEWADALIKHNALIDWESLALAFSKDLGSHLNNSSEEYYRDIAKVGDLLIKNATPGVLNMVNGDGKTLVEITAAERPEWLLELLKHGRDIDAHVPSTLVIFCSNFAKHLKAVPDMCYECARMLVAEQKKKYGERAFQMCNFLDLALSSFNMLNFWTYVATPNMIRFFVSVGCDINFQNEQGKTIFHWVYITGKPKLIALCQQLGASDTIRDNEGRRPSECVKKIKTWEVPVGKNK